jgi:septin family protein
MEELPKLTQKQLEKIQQDLRRHKDLMIKARNTILEQEVSTYPIFVIHRESVEIGIPLFIPADNEKEWHISMTTLEEMTAKSLIMGDKIEAFTSIFKDPNTHFCLFLIHAGTASFIFMPVDGKK